EAFGNYIGETDIEGLRTKLGPSRHALAELFPSLEPDVVRDAFDSSHARARLFEGVVALLGCASERGGLLLVLDDLNEADASTRELLDFLARRIARMPVMILGTYRSDGVGRK